VPVSALVNGKQPTQARPSDAVCAALILAGLASIYAAFLAPPELAFRLAPILMPPHWVSPGYPLLLIPPGKLRQVLTLLGITLIAFPLAWYAVGALERRTSTRTVYAVLTAAGAAACGSMVWLFGNRHFGAVDESLAIDVGWRQFLGQIPHRDFICTLPVGFYMPPAWAFRALGVRWSSLVTLLALFAALMFVWHALLLRRLTDSAVTALSATAAINAMAIIVASYWWYNPITVASAVAYIASALALLRDRTDRFAAVSYALSLCFVAAMKPNVGGPLIAAVTIILLTSKPHRLLVIAASCISFVVFVIVLALNHVSVTDMVGSYLSIAERGVPSSSAAFEDSSALETAAELLLLAVAITPFALFAPRLRRMAHAEWRTAAIFIGTATLGVYSVLAAGELKYLDIPYFVLVGAVAAPTVSPKAKRWTQTIVLGLAIIGCALGASRHRVEKVGFGAFFEWRLADRPPNAAFFDTLRTGPRFVRVVAEIRDFNRYAGRATLLFGPRLEAFYTVLGRPSPLHLPPLLWHRHTYHPVSLEPEILRTIVSAKFDYLVFMTYDFTHLPIQFDDIVLAKYDFRADLSRRYPDLWVFERRPPPPFQGPPLRNGLSVRDVMIMHHDLVPNRPYRRWPPPQ